MEEVKKRLCWIDIAKGISMCLVVLSHVVTWEKAKIFVGGVNFFHVPIWVFLFALFLKPRETFFKYTIKKILHLLKPYYIYGAFMIIIHIYDIDGYISILLGERKAGAIWFLPMLFSTSLLAFVVLKLSFSLQIIVCIVSLFVSYFLAEAQFILPLNLDVAFYMLFFIVIAYHYRMLILQYIFHWLIASISIIVIFVITLLSIEFNPNLMCNFYASKLGFLPLTIVLGLMGIYAICWISQKISISNIYLRRILLFIGQNSIIFIVLHQGLCYNLLPLRYFSFLHPGIIDLMAYIVVLLFCCLASLIINKYFKFTIK